MEDQGFSLFTGADYQVLRMSPALRDMILMPRFRETVLAHGGGFSRFESPEGLIIQPPIPKEYIESFGEAVIGLAETAWLDGAVPVQFNQAAEG